MSTWAQTPGGLMRTGTRAAALATIAGPEPLPRADQYPGQASEYRAAWGSQRWAFTTGEHGTQYVDNTQVRATQERLAAEGWQGCWIDAPEAGYPPTVLGPLYAGRHAQAARTGTATPEAGADAAWQQMIAESDYSQAPQAIPPGGGRIG